MNYWGDAQSNSVHLGTPRRMHTILSYFTGLVLYLILQFFWFSSSGGWGEMDGYNVLCKILIIVGPKSYSLELQPKDLKWLTKIILANGCK